MPLKKVLSEAEGASAKAKEHLPTHASRAAAEMPHNSEMSKYYNRPNDEGKKELHKKLLPTHASEADDQVPDEFHEEEDMEKDMEEAYEEDAEDFHVAKPAVAPAYDGHDIANRMKDGVYEEEELATHKSDGEEELKVTKKDGEEELATEDAELDDYNDEVLGEEDEVEMDEEEEAEHKKEMEEHVSVLFSNQDLSESFKKKTATIFEAAVREQVNKRSKKLQEKYNQKLRESKRKTFENLAKELGSFVDIVVEEWMTENQVAIEESIEVELAEQFFEGLKDLFEKNNIVVPKQKVNILNDLAEENKELKKQLNQSMSQILEMRKQEESRRKQEILEHSSKGLSETEKEKLFALAENVSYLNDKEFSEKVQTIREGYFPNSAKPMRDLSESQLENPVKSSEKENKKPNNPAMEAYMQTLSRMEKHKK